MKLSNALPILFCFNHIQRAGQPNTKLAPTPRIDCDYPPLCIKSTPNNHHNQIYLNNILSSVRHKHFEPIQLLVNIYSLVRSVYFSHQAQSKPAHLTIVKQQSIAQHQSIAKQDYFDFEAVKSIIDSNDFNYDELQICINKLLQAINELDEVEDNEDNKERTGTSSVPDFFITASYGDNTKFQTLRKLGVMAAKYMVQDEQVAYATILKFLALHRHMIAQLQSTPDAHLFGLSAPHDDGKFITTLWAQYPNALNKVLNTHNQFQNANQRDASMIKSLLVEQNLAHRNSRFLVKKITLDEPNSPIILSYVALELDGNSINPDKVHVIHGEHLLTQSEKEAARGLQLKCLEAVRQSLISQEAKDQLKTLNAIGLIGYIESLSTKHIRGGGAIPGMLTDALLTAHGLPANADTYTYNLWGESVSHPGSNHFSPAFSVENL